MCPRSIARRARGQDSQQSIGDAHVELGVYAEAFAAFDRMTLRPSAASYARVPYARELQGNLKGAIDAMKLSAGAHGPGRRLGIAG